MLAQATSLTQVVDEWPTWSEIVRTLTLRAGYNTSTVILGTTLLGFSAGVVGVFALLRKRALMADAVSHATLPGIAMAFLVATALGMSERSLAVLLFGGAVSGVAGALTVQLILRTTRLREDAAIGAVLSVFFGAGIVLLSYIQKNAPSGAAGLGHFIYGQTAAMGRGDVMLMGGLALTAMVCVVLLFKEFGLTCFNDAFARVDGWPVGLIDALMMAMVVVVTVAGLQAVGLLLVVAMLIIPPVAARFWTERLWLLVALSGVIGAMSGYFGSGVSALFPRKPVGAVIVLTAGAVFGVSLLAAPRRGVVATGVRRLWLRLRIASDHALEAASVKGGLDREAWRTLARRRGWPGWFRRIVGASLRRRGLALAGDGLMLTETGVQSGARVARNHALWEQYLVSYADVAPSHVDWSVDQVEHVLSDELVAELEAALAARARVGGAS